MIPILQDPPPHPETPPPGTQPIPSQRMPLNPMQQAVVQSLEDDGNVRFIRRHMGIAFFTLHVYIYIYLLSQHKFLCIILSELIP